MITKVKYNMINKYNFMTVEEAAKILKVAKITIYRYIKARQLVAYKIGKEFRIKQSGLDKFLKTKKTK